MIETALAAARQIFTPPFRKVLWKTLALTLALLSLVWIVLHKLLVGGAALPYPWVVTALSFIGGVGLFIGLAFLVTPISFLVAGFYFDELAETVERELAPGEPPGRSIPFADALWLSVKFSAVSLAVNLVALFLLLVPGINVAAFFGANAYLSGRGYFELAASRYLPFRDVRALRKMNEFRLFGAGLVIAAMLAVPLLNFLTPLFATAFMARITRSVMRSVRKSPRSTWG